MNYQLQIWNEFCQENKGYRRGHDQSATFYGCPDLRQQYKSKNDKRNSVNIDEMFKKDPEMEAIWFDYVSFRINYFNRDLPNTMLTICKNINTNINSNQNNNNNSNVENELKLLYESFTYYRNECGILPAKYDIFSKFDQFKTVMTRLVEFHENRNRNRNRNGNMKTRVTSPVLMYFLVWNGLFSLFKKYSKKSISGFGLQEGYGLDAYLHAKNSVDNYNNKELSSKSDDGIKIVTSKDISDYLIKNISSTGPFGNFVSEWNYRDYMTSIAFEKQKNGAFASQAQEKCVDILLNKNKVEFERLIDYCLQDIGDIRKYMVLSDNYQFCRQHVAISTFIINRMSLIIVCNLMMGQRGLIKNTSFVFVTCLSFWTFW